MMKTNKILIIGPTPPPYNGMSVTTETILDFQLDRDFKIIHLDTADRRSISNMGKFDFTNIRLAFEHCFKFLDLCFKEKPDLVYLPIAQNVAGYMRDSLFLIPCRIFNIKTVVHLHGSYFRGFYDNSNIFFKALIKFTLKNVKCAIVLGKNLKGIFKGLVPDDRIRVVSNGIRDSWLNRSFNNAAQKDIYQVLFLSNLMKEKGVFELLYSIPEVVSRVSNVKFVFSGSWLRDEEKAEALNFIETNKLQRFVEFCEVFNEAKVELLSKSDITALLSYGPPYEGQPLSILEAMAAGLPVLATDLGAVNEAVINGENGFIIKPQDRKDIAAKIILLLSDSDLRKKMGNRSRQIYLERFTKKAFGNNIADIFDYLLRNP